MIIQKNNPESIDITATYLKNAKLVIIPTDTIYGFSGIVPEGNELIIKAKGRDEGKPFIQLISSPEDLDQYSPDMLHKDLKALWPGAVTIIVRNNFGGTTAFRCPGDKWLRSVIQKTGKPIYSTSVNKAGEAALNTISEICAIFGMTADLIVDNGDSAESIASTIIDATNCACRIIRQGAVKIPTHLIS